MYHYYATYKTSVRDSPAGIIVMDVAAGHAMLWDHLANAWAYDPGLAIRFLDDFRNEDRQETIDRATAERITPSITGGEELPDEDTIAWVFRWEGRPPQGD